MFAARYFANRYFAPRYFPVDGDVLGGPIITMASIVNGFDTVSNIVDEVVSRSSIQKGVFTQSVIK